jgi:formylglycine-generating enzyme required for sulfatase activity
MGAAVRSRPEEPAVKTLRFVAVPLVLFVCGLLPAAPRPEPVPGGGDKVITNSIGMKLVLIPAGKFLMGSPEKEAERHPGEVQHEVEITRPFYMGAYEVTQGQYLKLVPKGTPHFHARNGGGPDYPMEHVKFREAVVFCQKLSELPAEMQAGRTYRLPTEAEWEYACRAGTATAFHTGDALSSTQANCNGNYPHGGAPKGPYLKQTAKVGSYAPNAWGLYDMHGNVMEWCADFYDPNYYKQSPKQDPAGPGKGVVTTEFPPDHFRVVRGGCWLDEARGCRSAYRFRMQPTEPYRLVGFRVVCVVAGGK